MKKYPTNHAYYILIDTSKRIHRVGRISKFNGQWVGKRYPTHEEAQAEADKMNERERGITIRNED